jgi:HSP20 family protein
MGILPFETFRTFGPGFDMNSAFTAWTPPCDIYETDKEIGLMMELPSMRKEDVHVTLENNVLTVRGKREFDETFNRENYHRIERQYGEFMRSFTLPTVVEGRKGFAEFKDGLLKITLPKNEAALPKQIEVQVK